MGDEPRGHSMNPHVVARQSVWSTVLDPNPPPRNTTGKDTFVQVEDSETMTKAFQPQGLLSAGLQDKDTISFYLSAYPGKKMTGHLIRRSQKINSQFRAERMEMDVYNRDGRLAPGMYAEVLFDSKGNSEAFTVPRPAVVTSTERKYVIAVRDGKTLRVDVTTGNESAEKVEITGNLRPGEQILAHASDDLQDGLTIK